ncbi:MAG: prepilin-type N-terminal cleavage/methylation domain-containing protein [Planctomycetota bacterium]|jgi:prepilin-type N-terminal cleavage/methylation domain-containing protein
MIKYIIISSAAGRGRSPCSPGFTLLEVMFAMTLLALVALIIGNSFHLGADAWDKGSKETGETQRLRVLSGLFSQEIKSAYPYELEIDDEKVVLFKGESDRILFVTTFADGSYGGVKWVNYSYKEGTLYQREGILPDKELEDKLSGGEEEEVDSGLDDIRFSYYSKEDEEWKESWDYTDKLPQAVKVKISYFQPFLVNIPMGSKDEEEEI